MKVVLVRAAATLLCAAALVIPSFAQTGSTPAPHGRNPFSRLQNALNLSSTQVSQLQGLLQSQRTAMQPLRADLKTKRQAVKTAMQGNDPAAIGSAMIALRASQTALKNARTANHNALMAVLTPAQAQIVTDYEKLARTGGAGAFGDGPRFGRHGGAHWHMRA